MYSNLGKNLTVIQRKEKFFLKYDVKKGDIKKLKTESINRCKNIKIKKKD